MDINWGVQWFWFAHLGFSLNLLSKMSVKSKLATWIYLLQTWLCHLRTDEARPKYQIYFTCKQWKSFPNVTDICLLLILLTYGILMLLRLHDLVVYCVHNFDLWRISKKYLISMSPSVSIEENEDKFIINEEI